MSIFSQPGLAPGLVICVVCVCPIIIKLGQMIEGVCALHCVKDVNFNKHLFHLFPIKLEIHGITVLFELDRDVYIS